MNGVPVLVLANKQDMKGAMSDAEVRHFWGEFYRSGQVNESLGLSSIKNREWGIFKTSASTGYGLTEAMDWLTTVIQK